MDFYSIFRSILRRFPHRKWVPLGRTVEGVSKKFNFFTGAQWPLICILLINMAIISDTALSDNVVFLR